MELTANEICIFIIGIYCLGITAFTLFFTLYYNRRCPNTTISIIIWAGFAVGLVWPLFLVPCLGVLFFISQPFFVRVFENLSPTSNNPELGSKPAPPKEKLYPRLVKKIPFEHPNISKQLARSIQCSICFENIEIEKSEIEKSNSERRTNHGTTDSVSECNGAEVDTLLHPLDTCITDCGHIFHYCCLDRWFETQCTCPTCRKAVYMNQCLSIKESGKRAQPLSIRGTMHLASLRRDRYATCIVGHAVFNEENEKDFNKTHPAVCTQDLEVGVHHQTTKKNKSTNDTTR